MARARTRLRALALLPFLLSPLARAVDFEDPATFGLKRSWTASSLGLPSRPGGLLFSADGGVLFIVSTAGNGDSNALYRVGVARGPGTNEVTDLVGPAVKVFDGSTTFPSLDAGLEIGPAGTLFYGYFDANYLAERPLGGAGSESAYDLAAVGAPISISGLTFSPFRVDPATGFGRLQISNGFLRNLYEVPLQGETPAASGLFPPGPGVVTLFARVVRAGVAGIQYVPAGALEGDLLYAATDDGELRRLVIDSATGLAIDAGTGEPTLGTTNPVDVPFASDLQGAAGVGGGPLGLEFDTLAAGQDLFVSTLDGSPRNSILQIGGFVFVETTSTTTSTTTTTLPPGCSPGTDLTAIRCRHEALIGTVSAASELGRLGPPLRRKARRAGKRLAAAEGRLAQGRRGATKRALAAALRSLGGFRRRLASPAGERLPSELRLVLEREAAAISDAVRLLRETL